jgi:hypothetical protein
VTSIAVQVLRCPNCGSEDVGSADTILATALGVWVIDPEKGRMFEPEGYTEVHWDTQVTADPENPAYCTRCSWSGSPDNMVPELVRGRDYNGMRG